MNKSLLLIVLLILFTTSSQSSNIHPYIEFDTLCELTFPIDINTIRSKVIPTITYAILIHDESGFKEGEVVEVIQDFANGTHYKVSTTKLCTWVHGYNLKFLPPSSSPPETLYPIELEAFINSSSNTSQTPYFVWVDLARQMIYVFKGSNQHWTLYKMLICATGKTTTSTVRGTFFISERGEILYSKEIVKYWVKFHDNYLFHSCPIDESGNVIDARLGMPISNGCIRMHEEDAQWFFNTIPSQTTVWIN
ncbi:MAG: L,D-transpeptidase [Cellulosilyticaceae bacterium]